MSTSSLGRRLMLVATAIGIVFIPSLFVLFQRLREWGHRRM